ncbi:STAS/SEC14 domain-containing protein [Nonomuraea sp. NBC_01738]|uniref:STAS/SEC14 domain-containing protein n=1 Tax=Nonomuraea sp. NBC_01738 TaxID=2976003 RepID=UPI002E10E72C|nr:STAS/SEC14 domain-containing protein [Nonomuraea sp. NBC_01738]
MLEPITGLPDGTIGFRAIGEITADDYQGTLLPNLDQALLDHEKVWLLFELGTEFKGYTLDALWADLRLGIEKFAAFERVALVTDLDWVRQAVSALGFLIPVKVRVFGTADEDAGRRWLIS